MSPKKAAKKKPPGTGKRTDITVELRANGTIVPLYPRLSEAGGDRVRWWNKDARGHTITFQIWPFVQAPGPIPVDPGKKSKWLTILPSAAQRGYDYDIDPPIAVPGQPPDSPAVVAEA